MSLEIGIVGLPNVGKSSLFNALTASSAAEAQNFPFTTIEPNVGVVAVPDVRLEFLAKTFQSAKTVPATIKFVDIAGLIKGAASGEGLGNQFLSHIRSVDAIVEVVRVFDDTKVIHVAGQVDPKEDIATINTELLLADLDQATRSLEKVDLAIKKQEKGAQELQNCLQQAIELFNDGQPLRTQSQLARELKQFQFLTAKPLVYVANVGELVDQAKIDQITKYAQAEQARAVIISVKTELEIIDLPENEQQEYRQELGLTSGLNQVIQESYQLLNLITFFTAGPKESHAWPIVHGTTAPQAAGEIHTDFAHGFIRAQIFNVDDLQQLGSEKAIKEAGRLRSEGKDYVMQDGDVVEFLFNV